VKVSSRQDMCRICFENKEADLPEDEKKVGEFAVKVAAHGDTMRAERRGVTHVRQCLEDLSSFLQEGDQVVSVKYLLGGHNET